MSIETHKTMESKYAREQALRTPIEEGRVISVDKANHTARVLLLRSDVTAEVRLTPTWGSDKQRMTVFYPLVDSIILVASVEQSHRYMISVGQTDNIQLNGGNRGFAVYIENLIRQQNELKARISSIQSSQTASAKAIASMNAPFRVPQWLQSVPQVSDILAMIDFGLPSINIPSPEGLIAAGNSAKSAIRNFKDWGQTALNKLEGAVDKVKEAYDKVQQSIDKVTNEINKVKNVVQTKISEGIEFAENQADQARAAAQSVKDNAVGRIKTQVDNATNIADEGTATVREAMVDAQVGVDENGDPITERVLPFGYPTVAGTKTVPDDGNGMPLRLPDGTVPKIAMTPTVEEQFNEQGEIIGTPDIPSAGAITPTPEELARATKNAAQAAIGNVGAQVQKALETAETLGALAGAAANIATAGLNPQAILIEINKLQTRDATKGGERGISNSQVTM